MAESSATIAPGHGREPGRRRAPRKGLLARLRPTPRPRTRVTGSHCATSPTAPTAPTVAPRRHRGSNRRRARCPRRPACHPAPRLPAYARPARHARGDARRRALPRLRLRVDRAPGARLRDPRPGRVRRALGVLPLRQHVHAPRPRRRPHAAALGGAGAGRGRAGLGDDGLPDLPPGPAHDPTALAHGGRQRLRGRAGAGPGRAAVHGRPLRDGAGRPRRHRLLRQRERDHPARRHPRRPVGRPGPRQRAAARRRRRRRVARACAPTR